MAEGSGTGKWLVGCAVALVGSAVLCCGGGLVGTWFLPDILLALGTSDHPLDVPVTAFDPAKQAEIERRVSEGLLGSGTVRLTPEDLNILVADEQAGEVHFTASGDTLGVLASVPIEEGSWLNVDATGRFVLEHGWATSMWIDRLVLSDWDLSDLVRGQDAAPHFNKNVTEIRAEDPDAAAVLDAVTRVTVEDGALVITADPAKLRDVTPPTRLSMP